MSEHTANSWFWAVFDSYRIVSEEDLRAAQQKVGRRYSESPVSGAV